MANKKSSKSDEAYHARYKQQNIFAINRKRKLMRLLKEHPNNKQVSEALNNVGSPRRCTPKKPVWSHTEISNIMLEKVFKNCKNPVPVKTYKYSDFALGVRAHDRQGKTVWV
jgi:hypothetical protein